MTNNLAKIRAALIAAQHGNTDITAGLAALAELERAAKEPVAWRYRYSDGKHSSAWLTNNNPPPKEDAAVADVQLLYTTPPPAPVVGPPDDADWSVTPSGSYCVDLDGAQGNFSILLQPDGRVGWAWLVGNEKSNGHGFTPEFWRGLQLCAPVAPGMFTAEEVDDAMCERVCAEYQRLESNARITGSRNVASFGHAMVAAVRTELGPTLGLVTREEMAARVEAAFKSGLERFAPFYRSDAEVHSAWLESDARKQLEAK